MMLTSTASIWWFFVIINVMSCEYHTISITKVHCDDFFKGLKALSNSASVSPAGGALDELLPAFLPVVPVVHALSYVRMLADTWQNFHQPKHRPPMFLHMLVPGGRLL